MTDDVARHERRGGRIAVVERDAQPDWRRWKLAFMGQWEHESEPSRLPVRRKQIRERLDLDRLVAKVKLGIEAPAHVPNLTVKHSVALRYLLTLVGDAATEPVSLNL